MKNSERINLLKTLELGKDATYSEIQKAYEHLVKLYSNSDSIPLAPLKNEFSVSEREKILSEIKYAFEKLSEELKPVEEMDFSIEEEIKVDLPAEDLTPQKVDGELFRIRREEKGLKIKEAAEELGISFKLLSAVENEKFSKFDDDGYLRWLIMKYASFLNIDKKIAAEDYMKLYRSSK